MVALTSWQSQQMNSLENQKKRIKLARLTFNVHFHTYLDKMVWATVTRKKEMHTVHQHTHRE